MLMRFDPFRELDRLTQQLAHTSTAAPVAPMEAYRSGDTFVVEFDLPGVDPSSVDVTVDKNVLTVKAHRERRLAEGDEVLVSERPYGDVSRELFLGDTLDTDAIEASFDQGVLTLRLRVAESAKPRKVQVAAGGGQREIAGSTA